MPGQSTLETPTPGRDQPRPFAPRRETVPLRRPGQRLTAPRRQAGATLASGRTGLRLPPILSDRRVRGWDAYGDPGWGEAPRRLLWLLRSARGPARPRHGRGLAPCDIPPPLLQNGLFGRPCGGRCLAAKRRRLARCARLAVLPAGRKARWQIRNCTPEHGP
jgi:hypothetical protein